MENAQYKHQLLTQDAEWIVKQVFGRAAERSLGLNIDMLPELVVWTLLRAKKTLGIEALSRSGVDCGNFEQQLDSFIESRHKRSRTGKLPIVDYPEEWLRLERIVGEWGRDEAMRLNTNWVGTEHLLLGAVANADAEFRSFLTENHVDYKAIKAAVVSILNIGQVD